MNGFSLSNRRAGEAKIVNAVCAKMGFCSFCCIILGHSTVLDDSRFSRDFHEFRKITKNIKIHYDVCVVSFFQWIDSIIVIVF